MLNGESPTSEPTYTLEQVARTIFHHGNVLEAAGRALERRASKVDALTTLRDRACAAAEAMVAIEDYIRDGTGCNCRPDERWQLQEDVDAEPHGMTLYWVLEVLPGLVLAADRALDDPESSVVGVAVPGGGKRRARAWESVGRLAGHVGGQLRAAGASLCDRAGVQPQWTCYRLASKVTRPILAPDEASAIDELLRC